MGTKEQGTLKRGEFLRSLGLSSSALMAFYCMGTTLSSCSTKDDDPAPTPPGGGMGVTGTTTGSGIDFNLDLTSATYRVLKTAGNALIVGDTIVIAADNDRFVALSKACTHQGTPVRFRNGPNDLMCPNHGSEFELNGMVKRGPAASPLTVFKTALSADGNSLNVKA